MKRRCATAGIMRVRPFADDSFSKALDSVLGNRTILCNSLIIGFAEFQP